MHAQVIATYRQLMASLHTLPDEIAAAQADLTVAAAKVAELKRYIANTQEAMDLRKAELAIKAATDGKNDAERKALLAGLVANDSASGRYRSSLLKDESLMIDAQRTVNMLTNDVDNLTRQFAAVGYQTKLHAALMGFLTDAMPGQQPDIDFGMANTHIDNGAGITADDAASIGL